MRTSIVFILTSILFIASCKAPSGNSQEIQQLKDTVIPNKSIPALTINGNEENGRKLFKMNCQACHSLSDVKFSGPGLKDIFTRVPKPADAWIKKYIFNNIKVRDEGDEYAIKLFKENNNAPMSVYENVLSENDVNDIINFLYYQNWSDSSQ